MPAGLGVGRFDADPERDDHFADHPAGVLGVEKGLCLLPDPVAVSVELHRGDPVVVGDVGDERFVQFGGFYLVSSRMQPSRVSDPEDASVVVPQ
jgi:hypothetical protein